MKTMCLLILIVAPMAAADPISLVCSSPTLQLNLQASRTSAQITRLGWDTEGTNRAGTNLLKAPIELRLLKGSAAVTTPVRVETDGKQWVRYYDKLGEGKELSWETAIGRDEMLVNLSVNNMAVSEVDRIELVFPFDPATAVTSVISSNWTDDGRFNLPAILSAPDLGQMLVTCPGVTGRIEGSRGDRWVTVTFELPAPTQAGLTIHFTPVVLPMPTGFSNEAQWKAARRGWFNLIQQSCGASGGSKDVVGVWANNVLSDPVSSVLYMLGDATMLVPDLAQGVSMPPILRRTIEYWIDHKTNSDGLIAYTARGTAGTDEPPPNGNVVESQNVLDANPAVLIGAWCYVKASGDTAWLKQRIGDLEFLSRYMENRDVDGDGLIESKQSGNSGSRPPRDPDNAWDCYASGHKDAYNNVLSYRAWRGLADLERMLGRTDQQQRYLQKADQLKAAFVPALYNPATGWLGWWRSRDGVLHDIYSDVPTSFAINYGLVDKDKGREMLETYWRALQATGFNRFDLGVPVTIRPVPREEMEAYFEFKQFLNGGCCVSNTSYLLNAMYIVGMNEQADTILNAMLKRQQDGAFPNGGGFQNGFVDKMGKGAEVFDWEGNPAGYEGHLVYCWAFLHSMLMKEPTLRDRVYRTD